MTAQIQTPAQPPDHVLNANLTNTPMKDYQGIRILPIGDNSSNGSFPAFAKKPTEGANIASNVNIGNSNTGLNQTNVSTNYIVSSDLFKQLSKSAKTYNVKALKYDVDPKRRKEEFLDWIEKMKEVTYTQQATCEYLDAFPKLPEVVDGPTNRVLAQFIRAYLTTEVKSLITEVDKADGIGAIASLQKLFAPRTNTSRQKAQTDLTSLSMFRNELVSAFIPRFHKKVQAVIASSNTKHPAPSDFDLTLLFLDKLKKGIRNQDQRTLILHYLKDCEDYSGEGEQPVTLTEIQISLTELEGDTECGICGSNQHPTRSCFKQGKSTKRTQAYQANEQSKARFNNLRCFKCGGSHRLSACPRATEEEKKRIYNEKFPNSKFQHPSKSHQPPRRKLNHSNQVEHEPSGQQGQSEQAALAKEKKTTSPTKQRAAPAWAKQSSHSAQSAIVHQANMAEHDQIIYGEAYHTIVHHNDPSPYTHITDWLIDSGCSISMTPHATDLICNKKKSKSTVEVATGVLTRAPIEGTVKIKLTDVRNGNECFVLLHNVLYVPGLNKRLMSVRQWNVTGGNVLFELDHCILTVCNQDTDECFDFAVRPPYMSSYQQLHEPQAYSIQAASPVNEKKKKRIDSSLLHRRLGHRSLPVLLHASDNELWDDVKVKFQRDSFCDDCKISTSRKTKRGDTSTQEALKVTKAGQAATMDIVPSLDARGLTKASHHKHHLLICDVYSRFTVILGLKDKSAYEVINAISAWMATYQTGEAMLHPGTLKGIRTDADPVFTSEELKEECNTKRIHLSHASPRHQEMNGLAERTWQSVRELAFSMMVHAHVGDEFYGFALDQAWKVYNCLPVKGLEHNGNPATPYEIFYGHKPSLLKFKVMFCPIIVNIGDKIGKNKKLRNQEKHARESSQRYPCGHCQQQ